jgi:hypothetical protein
MSKQTNLESGRIINGENVIIQTEEYRYNKKKITIALALAILVIALVTYAFTASDFNISGRPPESFEPTTTKFANQTKDGYFTIPILNLTDGRIERVSSQVDYTVKDLHSGIDSTFKLRGAVHGKSFYSTAMFDESKNLAISLSPNMHPKNNFIEAFIVWDIVDGQPTAYIYVDEEWKTYVGDSWIIWGKTFQKSRQFEWTSIGDGIYMNKVYDEWSRFDENLEAQEGGIAITNMNSKDAILGSNEKVVAAVFK